MKVIKSKKGETITETLAAILIIVLSMGVFVTGIDASFKLNSQAKEKDEQFIKDSNAAETEEYNTIGTVKVGDIAVDVKFTNVESEDDSEDESEFIAYKLYD